MSDDVRVLSDSELREATGTPGLHRRVAFESDEYWFGHVDAEPETISGWHHHGQNVTIGYVLNGQIRLEFGPGGSQSVEVHAGEYFTVPAEVIHREGNLSDTSAEVVLVRIGEGPPVFPVDGPAPG